MEMQINGTELVKCDLKDEKKVVVPKGITKIGYSAFLVPHWKHPSLETIVLPDGLVEIGEWAFYDCSGLKNIEMPSSIRSIGKNAFKNCAVLETIVLPEGLVNIDSGAFENCFSLKSIEIPSSVTYIGKEAFKECKALETIVLHEGLTKIGSSTFENCSALKNIEIPSSVTSIGRNAFENCAALETIVLHEGLAEIGEWAFYDCSGLKNIEIPSSVTSIGRNAFENCAALESMVIPEGVTRIESFTFCGCTALRELKISSCDINITVEAFDKSNSICVHVADPSKLKSREKLSLGLTMLSLPATDEARACRLAYQAAKQWLTWAVKTTENAAYVLQHIQTLLKEETKVTPGIAKQIIAYMAEMEKHLTREDVFGMLDLLESKNCQVNRDMFAHMAVSADSAQAESKVLEEELVSSILKQHIQENGELAFSDVVSNAVTGSTRIHYANSLQLANPDALRLLLAEYAVQWDRVYDSIPGQMYSIDVLENAAKVKVSKTADEIAALLNREELSVFLRKLANVNKAYRNFILAYARFATDAEIKEMISDIATNKKGKAKARYWAQTMTEAMKLNDSPSAMAYMEKHQMLDSYAAMRGMTAQELRDSSMMPDFGFDPDGIKRYDIGGNIIEVSIAPNLTCQLFDTAKQKVIKSIPKKSDDPQKAAACAADFADMKKQIGVFFKQRLAVLHELHLEQTALNGEVWHKIYLDHPVIKYLTRLLVWQDESGKTFMPMDNRIIDINEHPYEPKGKITLSHVLALSKEEISAWQIFLSSHKLVQPFAQIWEPVIPWKDEQIPNRYNGVVMSKEERSTVKRALASWGVSMMAESEEGVYNPRTLEYQFSGNGAFSFEHFYLLKYNTDTDWNTVLFEGHLAAESPHRNRILNAVLTHFDLMLIKKHIQQDQADELAKSDLIVFTAVQINDLLNQAIEFKATQCTAYLLNLKQQSFAAFEQADDLVLDW